MRSTCLPAVATAQTVDTLERDTGVTTVAYAHATFYAAFARLGLRDRIEGHGRLLASLATRLADGNKLC